MYEGPVQDLIDELGKLPGIGPKSAQRIAFHLLSVEPPELDRLQAALQQVRDGVRFCEVCGTVADQERCRICSDPRRDRTQICVVEEPKDVQAIERTREFRGRYHVLGGALDPLSGIGPDQLRIRELLTRIGNQEDGVDVTEVIIATDPNTEGEATATYLVRMLRDFPGLTVTRLASGLPMGGRPRVRRRADPRAGALGPTHTVTAPRRTGEQTRRRILDAAGMAFATRPYREITLKDIAEDAGVSPALIIKYFGSKEQLFDALVDFQSAADVLFDGPLEQLGERMVSMLARPLEPYKPLSMNILFMSGASEESNSKLRENYSKQMIDALAARLSGPDARLRAELAMSMVTGLAIMRRRMLAERATGSVPDVVARYAPLVQELLDGAE